MQVSFYTGQITWNEDKKTGRGILTLRGDDGTVENVEHDDPIKDSDSDHVAGLFGGFDWVERNGDVIHVGNRITLEAVRQALSGGLANDAEYWDDAQAILRQIPDTLDELATASRPSDAIDAIRLAMHDVYRHHAATGAEC